MLFGLALLGAITLNAGSVVAQNSGNLEATAALENRIQQLEAQINDLQVIIGTLETIIKQGGASGGAAVSNGFSGSTGGGFSPSGGLSGGANDRLESLETQIGAITRQLETYGREIADLRLSGGNPGIRPQQPNALNEGSNQFLNENAIRTAPLDQLPQNQSASGGGFGDLLVAPDQGQGSTQNLQTDNRQGSGAPQRTLTARLNSNNPKEIYQEAYGFLLGRDYESVESAFTEFLKRFPKDPLAGNAQYWLGESFYVRGNYRKAAENFVKGYSNYKKHQKAPESLLKLAMSLKRLGQNDAACSTFKELSQRFPRAEGRVKQRASIESKSAGC